MNITVISLVLLALIAPAIGWIILRKKIQDVHLHYIGVAVLSVILVFAALAGSIVGQSYDIEILNGYVTGKQSRKVSCEHSYDCNCKTVRSCSGSGKNRSCSSSRVCDTCYDHSYDVDWEVHTSINSFNISRVNRQGTTEPQRFTKVAVGDPVSTTHHYTNWVKAAPDSLFSHIKTTVHSPNLLAMIPSYPASVYDYHYVDRVISYGVPVVDIKQWNLDLAKVNAVLGASKQVNIIVLMVKTTDPTYEYALRDAWLGGKKNDVIVIFGVTEYPTISWVRVMSWTDKQILKVELRDDLIEIGTLQDRGVVLKSISDNVKKSFKRKEMRDFEYLQDEIVPPDWLIAVLVLLIIGGNIGVVFYRRM